MLIRISKVCNNISPRHRDAPSVCRMAYYSGHPGTQMSAPKYASDVQVPMQQEQLQQQGMSVVTSAPRWSWCSLGWSIFAWLCCGSLCGVFGFMFAILSYVDHKAHDYERARYKRRWSWGCTIVGILVFTVIIVAIIIAVVAFTASVTMFLEQRGYNLRFFRIA